MRRIFLTLASVWLIGAANAQAAAGEELVMPYACSVENGHVSLRSADATKYEIVGKREQQPLTVCRPSTGSDCRTLMVHRFSISCGGVQVPWVQVAAAARSAEAPKSWIDDGRLNMLLATRSSTLKCADHAFSFLKRMGLDAIPECMPWQRRITADHIIVPAGYAPIGQYGARLAFSKPKLIKKPVLVRPPEPATASATQELSSPTSTLAAAAAAIPPAPEPVSQPVLEEPAESEALVIAAWSAAAEAPVAASSIETGSITQIMASREAEQAAATAEAHNNESLAPPPHGAQVASVQFARLAELGNAAWLTVTRFVERTDISALAAGPLSTPFLWISVVLLLSTLTWFAWRHDHTVTGTPAPRGNVRNRDHVHRLSYGPASPAPMRVDLANAGETCAALLAQTQMVAEQISSAAPLREVLMGELAQVRQRLAFACVQAASGGQASLRAAPQFRALVREIERIRRIADSAAASMSEGDSASTSVPRTRSEAYSVLGINPDVSDRVAKKIVDGLRASWHPDHAKNDSDLREREARIKRINVAWELINEKRQQAA